jgi:hypothetical protein
MGYTTGAKILPNIIDEIANGLIATAGGYWTNADTAWNTSAKDADLARRALKYQNGSEVVYLTLESMNTQMNTFHDGSYWQYTKGLRVNFSAEWDNIGHAPSSRMYHTHIQFEARYRYSPVSANLATLQITYYLWIDATGFVITGKPEPDSTDD